MKKDWIDRELTIEVIVGAFMVMIFLGLGYFTIVLSKEAWFVKKCPMEVIFKDVMGLGEGDNVVVRGMPVGKVKSLDLDEKGEGVVVSLMLDEKLHMKKDYKITVVSTSILGGRYLQIYEGSEDLPELSAESVFRGEKPYDLMADAAELVNAVKEGIIDGGVVDNLKSAASQIKEITERLSMGKGTLGRLLSEDDQLYQDFSAAVSSLKNIAGRIEKGEGMLGQLVHDETLYKEIQQAIEEIRLTVDDYRETAPIVTFTSIFFGAF